MFVFCDGMDSYAAAADIPKKWGLAPGTFGFSSTGGRFGGGAITNNGANTSDILRSLVYWSPGNNVVLEYGFYFKASSPPSVGGLPFFAGITASNGILTGSGSNASIWLNINTSGQPVLMCNGIQATSTINVCDGNWHWIECYFSTSWGNGSKGLYVDAVNMGGFNVGASTLAGFPVAFGFIAIGTAYSIDDFIIGDSNTGWPNAGNASADIPLNPRKITTKRPVSDASVTFTTTSSGSTHFNLVNEVNPDTTTWVQDSISGHKDLFNMSALGYTPTGIDSAVLNVYWSNPNAGTINAGLACKSVATEADSPSSVVPLSYQTIQNSFHLDPNGNIAWTGAAIDAAQFGFFNV